MSGTKWALLALIAFGLWLYKYKIHLDQPAAAPSHNLADSMPAASNAFVDYTKGLQDDVALARKNVKKYEASSRTESKAAGEGDGAQ